MNLEKGKFYKTRDGRKAECLTTTLTTGGEFTCICEIEGAFETYLPNGKYDTPDCDNRLDLISEWKEPEWFWVNVFPMNSGGVMFGNEVYSTLEAAVARQSKYTLATIGICPETRESIFHPVERE